MAGDQNGETAPSAHARFVENVAFHLSHDDARNAQSKTGARLPCGQGVVDAMVARVGDIDIVIMAAGVLGNQDTLEADPASAA